MGIDAAFVLMPETSAHFDDFPQPGKGEVGLTGQRGHVKLIAEAQAV